MKNNKKLLLSLILLTSLVAVACNNKTSSSSEIEDESSSIFSSDSIDSSDVEQSTSSSSSENNWSSHFETKCKDGLHDYIKCVPVEGGHKKYCEKCDLLIGEKENHVYFDDEYLYCPTCGFYDSRLTQYNLSEDFNVVVRTVSGNATRRILSNLYQAVNGGLFTLSSPSNAHSSYTDSNVEGARFYYDNSVDDGTKLFVLKETAFRESISPCKDIYTYTLSVYVGITSGTFSYTNGHITINSQAISNWLEAHSASKQVTYKYLNMHHHGDDYRVPVPGTCAIINEVTCEDCTQFLYQQVTYTHQFSDTQWLYDGKNGFDQTILDCLNSVVEEPISVYGKTSCSKCGTSFIDAPLSSFDSNHASNDGSISVSRYEYDSETNMFRYFNDYSVEYTHFDHVLKNGECIFCHTKP